MNGIQLSPEEEAEARRMQEIALKAELKSKLLSAESNKTVTTATSTSSSPSPALFLSKKEREALALERLAKKREEQEEKAREAAKNHHRFVTGEAMEERRREERERERREREERDRREIDENKKAKEHDHEIKAIRDHYMGGQERKRKILNPTEKFKKLFQADWDADEDTTMNDVNPLYTDRVRINALFGRGYIAGLDPTEQRKKSNFLLNLSEKRLAETRRLEEEEGKLSKEELAERARMRDRAVQLLRAQQSKDLELLDSMEAEKMGTHWSSKSLEEMTERDWRIFREDFDIRIKGGRATLPLRRWDEGNFPEVIMKAIQEAGYKDPSPIQRQAIPIGQARKDIIGIAETGSGKTAAFLYSSSINNSFLLYN